MKLHGLELLVGDEGPAASMPGGHPGVLYQKVTEDAETVNHLRMEYAALLDLFVDGELEKLDLAPKYVRHELFGEFHNPKSCADYPV
mgnify:CR=1 FL=1